MSPNPESSNNTANSPGKNPPQKPSESTKDASKETSSETEDHLATVSNNRERALTTACTTSTTTGIRVDQCLATESANMAPTSEERKKTRATLAEVEKQKPSDPITVTINRDNSLTEGPLDIDTALRETMKRENNDSKKAYQHLVDFGKSLKSNPQKLFSLVKALDNMLYKKYNMQPNATETLPEQSSVLQRYFSEDKTTNFTCADISLFMVRYLDEIGVEAISFNGMAMVNQEDKARFSATGHALTAVNLGNDTYGIVGLSENMIIPAKSLEEAYKALAKHSNQFAPQGTMTMYGAKNGEYYRKYILDLETLYGKDVEFNSDKNLQINTSFVNDLEALNSMQKRDLIKALQQSGKHGFKISSISFQGGATLETGGLNSGTTVRFEGLLQDGSYRSLDFNLNMASDESRFGAIMQTVTKSTVETFEVELGERRTEDTALFDTANSRGAKAQYNRTQRLSPQDTVKVGAEGSFEQTEGASRTIGGGNKETSINTLSYSADGRYIRTFNPTNGLAIDLWVGVGSTGYNVTAESTARKGSETTLGENNDFDFRFTQDVGAVARGGTETLNYRGAISFSVVEDTNLADPSTQSIGISPGTMQRGELMIVYRPVEGLNLYGKANAVRLTTPVQTRTAAGYKVGASLTDLAGIPGLNLSTDFSDTRSQDNLHMSNISSPMTDTRKTVIHAGISYTDKSVGGTIGLSAERGKQNDNLTERSDTNTTVGANYSIRF